ncbi:TPA: 2-oxoglutarate translocator [Clostridioides difficile]|nr:2-oxoglutarate translocator [Clostridioides difficile]
MRNNKSKVLLGILCIATGMAVILSMLLPGWIWSALTALILIGCGALLFFC